MVQGSGVGGAAEAGDEFGSALAAGFFDTGPSDLAIGAPFEDLGATTDAGAVNVVYGSNTGLVGRNQTLTQNSPGVVGTAESGDLFGAALARGIFLNNFNGDDFADLAIGAVGEDVGTAADAGAVNVQYGSATGLPGPGGQLSPRTALGWAAAPNRATASGLPWTEPHAPQAADDLTVTRPPGAHPGMATGGTRHHQPPSVGVLVGACTSLRLRLLLCGSGGG